METIRLRLQDLTDLKKVGKEWVASCPQCGRRHLWVNMQKKVYHCFHAGCNCKGHFIDEEGEWIKQISKVRSQSLETERKEQKANSYMMLTNSAEGDDSVPMIPTDFVTVKPEIRSKIAELPVPGAPLNPEQARVVGYLQSIGISVETARGLHIGCALHYIEEDKEGQRKIGREVPCLTYPTLVNDHVVNIKYRSVEQRSDGTYLKGFTQDCPNTPQPPFNIDCINPLFLESPAANIQLIVVEGEHDVLTLMECGYPYVISAGSANVDVPKVFEAFESWLKGVNQVVICGDSDKSGRVLVKNLQKFFGVKAFTATLPTDCKDISEVYLTYGADTVCQVINEATPAQTSDIVHVHDHAEGIIEVLHDHIDHGYSVGHGALTEQVFRLTSTGGLIIVTGKPNAGKTDFLNDLMARLMAKEDKQVCFTSFEVPDKRKHMAKMVKLMLGRSNLTNYSREHLEPFITYLDHHMVHLDLCEHAPSVKNILYLADLVRLQRRLDFLVVDPYLFLETEASRNTTETQSIKAMLTEFQTWGRRNNIWVVIVAHPRKLQKISGSNELEEIDMFAISGSAHWANLGDYIFTLKRKQTDFMGTDGRPRSITQLDMLKVRDQDYCHTGTVFYLRQPCGRYDERPSEQLIIQEFDGVTHGETESSLWLPN